MPNKSRLEKPNLLESKENSPVLCEECKKLFITHEVGVCTNCKGSTTSGRYKLCRKCAIEFGSCQRCSRIRISP